MQRPPSDPPPGPPPKRQGRDVTRLEKTLWDTVTKDIVVPAPVAPKKTARVHLPGGSALDKGLQKKLRQGLIPIDDRIDLHGQTQDRAHIMLLGFIRDAYAAGARCVLVITGKGARPSADPDAWYEGQPGVLRRLAPLWLAEDALKALVLAVEPAQPRHGGAGAFYVLLRRRRE